MIIFVARAKINLTTARAKIKIIKAITQLNNEKPLPLDDILYSSMNKRFAIKLPQCDSKKSNLYFFIYP